MSLNRSWSRQAMMALINVYERKPCLYDTQSPDYHNRQANRDVLEEMVHAVAQFHPHVTAEDCRKKYQCLRNQFLAECRKLADSKKSGAGTSSVYTPKLWCFEALMFLRDFVKVRAGTFVGGEDVEEVEDLEEAVKIEYLDEVSEYSELLAHSPSTRFESCTSIASAIKTERRNSAPSSLLAAAEKRSSATIGPDRRSSFPSPIPGCSTERFTPFSQKKRKISDATGSPSYSRSREETPNRESTPTERGRSDTATTIASALQKLADKLTSKDDYDVFGNFVASRLRKLGENYSEEVEHEIVNLIFAAERRKKYES